MLTPAKINPLRTNALLAGVEHAFDRARRYSALHVVQETRPTHSCFADGGR